MDFNAGILSLSNSANMHINEFSIKSDLEKSNGFNPVLKEEEKEEDVFSLYNKINVAFQPKNINRFLLIADCWLESQAID